MTSSVSSFCFRKGSHIPGLAHSAMLRAEDFLCCNAPAGAGRRLSLYFPLSFLRYISLGDGRL